VGDEQGTLCDALSSLGQAGQVYLITRLCAHVPAAPLTVTIAGDNLKTVTPDHARHEDLRTWAATAVFDLDLVVPVHHPPGAIFPEASLAESDRVLAAELRRHLP
jgi:hypothetical protein